MTYTEDQLLMLSGIQHFMFCPRQWALIHIEQEWDENKLTAEGQILHTNVDNPFYRQKNGNRITLRSVPIISYNIGLYGLTDAVELISTNDKAIGIIHPSYKGLWELYPVEYKRGKPKYNELDNIDAVQLTAQVICLEEMYNTHINMGAFYYGETNHRTEISITNSLRQLATECSERMHYLYDNQIIPHAEKKKCCKNCSLANKCLPGTGQKSAKDYIKRNLYEDFT